MKKTPSIRTKISARKVSDKVENILIVFRIESKNALRTAKELAIFLKKDQKKIFSHPDQTISKDVKKATNIALDQCDLVIVLGGDGTYLEAVRILSGRTIPILGVNMGALGFLTQVKLKDLYPSVKLTLTGKMQTRPRSLISVTIKKNGKLHEKMTALNDVVIERGPGNHLLHLGIFHNKQVVCEIKADGLIASTPTGSTAYNLAAGGPILHPEVDALVVTPICPHALTNRPIVFPSQYELTIKLIAKNKTARVTVDGQHGVDLKYNDEILIRKSSHQHYVLRRPTHNYFNLLREKLKFGE